MLPKVLLIYPISRDLLLIRIPYLQFIMKTVANSLCVLGCFGRIDLKLPPNRVVKLLSCLVIPRVVT